MSRCRLVPVGWQQDGSIILRLVGTVAVIGVNNDRCFSFKPALEAIPRLCNYALADHLRDDSDAAGRLCGSIVGPEGSWYRIFNNAISRLNPSQQKPVSVESKCPRWWRGVTASGRVLIKQPFGSGKHTAEMLVSSPFCKVSTKILDGDKSLGTQRLLSRGQLMRLHESQVILIAEDGSEVVAFDAKAMLFGWVEQILKELEGTFAFLNDRSEFAQDSEDACAKTVDEITELLSHGQGVVVSSAALTLNRSLWVIVQAEGQLAHRCFIVRAELNVDPHRCTKMLRIDLSPDQPADESEWYPNVRVDVVNVASCELFSTFKQAFGVGEYFKKNNQSHAFFPCIQAAAENFVLIDIKTENMHHGCASQVFLLDVREQVVVNDFAYDRPLAFVLEDNQLDVIGNVFSGIFLGAKQSWILCDCEGSLETNALLGEFSITVLVVKKIDSINESEFRWQLLCLEHGQEFSLKTMTLSYSRRSGRCTVNDEHIPIPVVGKVQCVDCDGDFLVMGFKSGKIEIRRKDDWFCLFRNCYLNGPVQHLSICKEDSRTMVAAFDGEVRWFSVE